MRKTALSEYPEVNNVKPLDWLSTDGRFACVPYTVSGLVIEVATMQPMPANKVIVQNIGQSTAISHDGQYLIVTPALQAGPGLMMRIDGTVVSRLSLRGRPNPSFTPADDAIYYSYYSPDGQLENVTCVLQTLDGKRKYELQVHDGLNRMVVSRDLSRVVTFGYSHTLRVWALPQRRVVLEKKFGAPNHSAGLGLSGDASRVAIGVCKSDPDRDPRDLLQERPPVRLHERQIINGSTEMQSVLFTIDVVDTFDAATGEQLGEVTLSGGDLKRISATADEAIFSVDNRLVVVRLPDGEVLREYHVQPLPKVQYYSDDLSTVILRDDEHEWVLKLTRELAGE